jgi:ABC-2 type transport system permease protein
VSVALPPVAERHGGFVDDVLVVAWRGLLHMRREPEALADVTLQPIMFVVLFAYVFGGAIAIEGGTYTEFLMGGIFAQTLFFGMFGVAMALASDRRNGAVDRFRSLPMARGAVLGGHAAAHMVRGLIPIVLMSLCGLAIGWRITSTPAMATAGFLLMVAFSFAVIWLGILLGSAMPSPEAVQGVGFVVVFPITFVASTFVPVKTLPGVLQTFAEWNPVTSLAEALRYLFGNPHAPRTGNAPWSLQHSVAYTVLWIVGLVVVCAPLAVYVYNRRTRD